MHRSALLLIVLALSACGHAASTTQPAAAPATTTTVPPVLTKAAYARALLDAYHRYPGRDPSLYGRIAEALNLITPPPGYALRHQALVAEYLAVSQMSTANGVALGTAEGKADVDLMNLAYELDPTAH